MVNNSSRSIGTAMFNKYGFNGKWPRAWVLVIGIFLAFFTFAIAGMEVGHTVYEPFRSTAFGGFIVFFPLLICAIFVMVTGEFQYLSFLNGSNAHIVHLLTINSEVVGANVYRSESGNFLVLCKQTSRVGNISPLVS
jgi:hypothetical protein